MNIDQLSNTALWEWPEGAGEVIKKAILNKDRPLDERLLAVELAGNEIVMEDKLALLLLAMIRDDKEEEQLRCQAALSLAPVLEFTDTMEFDDPDDIIITPEVFETICSELKSEFDNTTNSKELRRQILETSVHAPKDWHENAIRNAYDSDDEEWFQTAIIGMQYIDGFNKEIIAALTHQDFEILNIAISAAGNWEIKEAWPVIKAIMSDENADKWLLITAIEAAPYVNRHESYPFLDFFSESDDEDIVDAAEESILAVQFLMNDTGLEFDDFNHPLSDD